MSDVYYWLASAAIPAILFLASGVVYGARIIRQKYTGLKHEDGVKPALNNKLIVRDTYDKPDDMITDVIMPPLTQRQILRQKLTIPELLNNNNKVAMSPGLEAIYKTSVNTLNISAKDICHIKENLKLDTASLKSGSGGSSTPSPDNYDAGRWVEEKRQLYGTCMRRRGSPTGSAGRGVKRVTFDERSCKRPAVARALGFTCLTREACSCALTLYFYNRPLVS